MYNRSLQNPKKQHIKSESVTHKDIPFKPGMFCVSKPSQQQFSGAIQDTSWLEALRHLDQGRFSVYQWRRYIGRHVPKEKEETLQIDLTNFRSNAKGQKDSFII